MSGRFLIHVRRSLNLAEDAPASWTWKSALGVVIPVVDKSEVSEVGFRGQCVQVLSILAVRPWATSVSHFLICEVGALMHHLTGLLGELIYAN